MEPNSGYIAKAVMSSGTGGKAYDLLMTTGYNHYLNETAAFVSQHNFFDAPLLIAATRHVLAQIESEFGDECTAMVKEIEKNTVFVPVEQ